MAPFERHTCDAEFQLKAISDAVEHGNRAAAREFNIDESMVRDWREQQDELRQVKKTKQFPRERSEMATVRGQTPTVGCWTESSKKQRLYSHSPNEGNSARTRREDQWR